MNGLCALQQDVRGVFSPARKADVASCPSCQRDMPNLDHCKWAARVPSAGVPIIVHRIGSVRAQRTTLGEIHDSFPAAISCVSPRVLQHCRPCRGSRGRRPIRCDRSQ